VGHTHGQAGDLISLLLFLESRLKMSELGSSVSIVSGSRLDDPVVEVRSPAEATEGLRESEEEICRREEEEKSEILGSRKEGGIKLHPTIFQVGEMFNKDNLSTKAQGKQ
jgi:hypothetical protein